MEVVVPIYMDNSNSWALKYGDANTAILQGNQRYFALCRNPGWQTKIACDVNTQIFEGAVHKRYSIMDLIEVFTRTSFEDRNDIYTREVVRLRSKLQKRRW
jgi:predicted naringenin-chalcone synthase